MENPIFFVLSFNPDPEYEYQWERWWPVLAAEDRQTCRRFIRAHPESRYRIVRVPERLIEDETADIWQYVLDHNPALNA